ncbi:zinc-dependent metalloprotease family protein [Ferruginibacter sp.]
MKYYCLIILITVILPCCRQKENKPGAPKPNADMVVRIQPFTDMDNGEVQQLARAVQKLFPRVIISPAVELPQFAYYAARGRYKADSLLKYLKAVGKPNEILIGVTTHDISTSKDAIPDWGVMGLGSCPGSSCVASTFRLNMTKGKEQLFKVAIHELGHNFGLPHCPNAGCYMRDAEGGNPTDDEKDFCASCKQYLRRYYWKL